MSDVKEIWKQLNNRIRLPYYIGPRKALILHNHILNSDPCEPDAPDTLGVDVDGDGEIDATYVKESDE